MILREQIMHIFPDAECSEHLGETTLTLSPDELLSVMQVLRDDTRFDFCQLMDVTAVDYLMYQKGDWKGDALGDENFSRGRQAPAYSSDMNDRFAVVYHLLSHKSKARLRVKVFLPKGQQDIHSMTCLWPSANWAEREVYDLFGIIFSTHPSLDRILTDYGFIGHPFRKDYPLAGHYELRYDAPLASVVSEPTDVVARVEVAKVVRLGESDG